MSSIVIKYQDLIKKLKGSWLVIVRLWFKAVDIHVAGRWGQLDDSPLEVLVDPGSRRPTSLGSRAVRWVLGRKPGPTCPLLPRRPPRAFHRVLSRGSRGRCWGQREPTCRPRTPHTLLPDRSRSCAPRPKGSCPSGPSRLSMIHLCSERRTRPASPLRPQSSSWARSVAWTRVGSWTLSYLRKGDSVSSLRLQTRIKKKYWPLLNTGRPKIF